MEFGVVTQEKFLLLPVFTQTSLTSLTRDTLKIGSSSEGELKRAAMPLAVGFEADANSWLTLRGSITQLVPLLTS